MIRSICRGLPICFLLATSLLAADPPHVAQIARLVVGVFPLGAADGHIGAGQPFEADQAGQLIGQIVLEIGPLGRNLIAAGLIALPDVIEPIEVVVLVQIAEVSGAAGE